MEALPKIVDAAADYCVLYRSPLVVRADAVENRDIVAGSLRLIVHILFVNAL